MKKQKITIIWMKYQYKIKTFFTVVAILMVLYTILMIRKLDDPNPFGDYRIYTDALNSSEPYTVSGFYYLPIFFVIFFPIVYTPIFIIMMLCSTFTVSYILYQDNEDRFVFYYFTILNCLLFIPANLDVIISLACLLYRKGHNSALLIILIKPQIFFLIPLLTDNKKHWTGLVVYGFVSYLIMGHYQSFGLIKLAETFLRPSIFLIVYLWLKYEKKQLLAC